MLLLSRAMGRVSRFHQDFLFDSLFAGNCAQGLCQSDPNLDLTVVVRSLVLSLEQLVSSPIQWSHVKGHSSNPWNDLADAVARHAQSHRVETFNL